jgi:hypothetical protein
MLRSLPRHLRISSRPLRSLIYAPRLTQLPTLKRQYASEAASPSPNDAFATGNNAYYAEEYVQNADALRRVAVELK